MLKVIAVSAPDWIAGSKDGSALDSRDPASLFNACRYAALLSESESGPWANSNWASGRSERRRNVMLMYSLDDMAAFEQMLIRETPNLLLIGAMTLCLPGAVRCAERAKAILGRDVFVVLGGRHANETMYLSAPSARHADAVRHHRASPLRLMAAGRIPPVFDAVVSGDGEHVIAALGALVESANATAAGAAQVELAKLDKNIPGEWIVGSVDGGCVRVVVSAGAPIDYNRLPSPSRMFGVAAAFDVFDGRMTAHVFSDMGRGCVYDCSFCSERRSVAGSLRDLPNAGNRLYRQLRDAHDVIVQDHPGRGASAFVEDSVMLGGSPKLVDKFAGLLEDHPLRISFGAQFTIDQILTRGSEIARIARNGFSYVFVGVETLSPDTVGGMSKDIGRNRNTWLHRIRQALHFLRDHDVLCGCSVLFGLGETHADRIELLQNLGRLREDVGAPHPISINWAVQHPLCDDDGGAGYDYVEWGTPDCEYLPYFHRFGEASLRYPLPHVGPPRLQDVKEVSELLASLRMSRPLPGRHAQAS